MPGRCNHYHRGEEEITELSGIKPKGRKEIAVSFNPRKVEVKTGV